MVALYVDGQQVGTLDDAGQRLRELIEGRQTVELRDGASGRTLGTVKPEPICDWEPDLTHEEVLRRIQEPGGMPLNEFLQRLGLK